MKTLWRLINPARTLDKALERLAIDLRDGTIGPDACDMSTWANRCGTVMCIGGHLLARGHQDLLRQEGCTFFDVSYAGYATQAIKAPYGSALHNLFIPYDGYTGDDESIRSAIDTRNPLAMAEAIDRYRAGERWPWEGVDLEQKGPSAFGDY